MPWGFPLKPLPSRHIGRALLAISFLINLLLGGFLILADDRVNSLQTEMNILQTELAQLDADLREKTISTRELENRVVLLQARLTLLQSNYDGLVSENKDLLAQITNLRIQTTQLQLEITRLQSQISQLQSQVSQLQSTLAQLKEVAGSSIYYDSTTLYTGTLACTGSMRPTLDCGDIVLRYTPRSATEIRVGDIITYYIPAQYDYCDFAGIPIIHRVVEITSGPVFWAQGDNNLVRDDCGVPFWAVTSKVIGVVWA